jgi:hypothetical protein
MDENVVDINTICSFLYYLLLVMLHKEQGNINFSPII